MTFSPSDYYQGYKEIRNKLRNLKANTVLTECIRYLNKKTSNANSELNKQPWIAMLLIKWAYIDEQVQHPGKVDATTNDVAILLRATYELTNKLRNPSEYASVYMFMRALAFQQFIYQRAINLGSLCRERLFFGTLASNHQIHRLFKGKTSLTPSEFFSISLAIIAAVETSGPIIRLDNFRSLFVEAEINKVRICLDLMSVPGNCVLTYMRNHGLTERRPEEFYEAPPFIDAPLLKDGDNYLVVHKMLFFRAIETFFYDFMRRNFMDRFMPKFGSEIFERYIQNGLNYAKIDFTTEEELKRSLGSGQVVDFIIHEENTNIFIDAKAVEMNDKGRAAYSPATLSSSLKASILKAIDQAHDVNSRLSKQDPSLRLSQKNVNYLVVVTYKELYATNGTRLKNELASEAFTKITEKYSPDCHIPPENIFFLTINDFDNLIQAISTEKTTALAILNEAKHRDTDPYTSCFHFEQHLAAAGFRENPEYLEKSLDDIFDHLKKIVIQQR